MIDRELSDLFYALNFAAMEMKPDGRFFLLGKGPDWIHHFCGDNVSNECRMEPVCMFGFLDNFIETAKTFWKKKKVGCIKSGIWIEEDESGKEFMYEATAVTTINKCILIIAQDQYAFKEKKALIQKGRKLALDYHNLQKTEREIHQDKNELEERVKERTSELESANLKLARELKMRKQIEAERAMITKELQQVQKMEAIGTLAGGIAHDFNNILSAVIGFTELALSEIKPNSTVAHKMKQVLISADRAKKLVRQILEFSRQAKEDAQPVQVKKIILEALTLIRASLPTTIEIRQNLSSNACVLADSTQLHQVIMNLCTNAAQAMHESGGIITIFLHEIEVDADTADIPVNLNPGAYIRLTVEDTGCGIPCEIIERIFDPFFTTKEKDEGTGMGLAVVHGIIKSCGGYISVKSLPGKGTAFHVFLPAIEEAIDLMNEKKEKITGGNERILFIDDEPLQTEFAEDYLNKLGYHVTALTDSRKAFERFRDSPDSYDLVITDLTMPKMTGKVLAQEMHIIRPNLPIILCSGYSESIHRVKALEMGIHDYLMKPIALKDLADTIRKVLDDT